MIGWLTPVAETCGLELWCGLVTWWGEPCLAMACMSISGRTGSPGKADSARMAASICARFTVEGGTCTLAAGGGTEAGGGFCTAPAAGFQASHCNSCLEKLHPHAQHDGGWDVHTCWHQQCGQTVQAAVFKNHIMLYQNLRHA